MNKYFSVIFCLLSLVLLSVVIATNKAQISTASSKTSEIIEVPGLDAEKQFDLINQWRISENLSAYQKDERLCEIANDRVDDTPLSHKEFRDKIASKYNAILGNNIEVSENLGFDWSEQKMLDGWLASASHSAALHKDYKYSCVSCKGNYCVQIFSNL